MTRYRLTDLLIVGEAIAFLCLARIALTAVAFRRLAPWISRSLDGGRIDGEQVARRVGWAVRTAARRGPIPAVCFPQALAAQMMLRRRGVACTLYYGLAKSEEVLKGHVWVMAGDVPVVGTANAHEFTLIATFPPSVLPAGAPQADVAG